METLIQEELERVVARQEKQLTTRLSTFSKGSLLRIVKVLGGPLGKNVKLLPDEQKFVEDLQDYFENHLASLGLDKELQENENE